jgi:hypothetical protein
MPKTWPTKNFFCGLVGKEVYNMCMEYDENTSYIKEMLTWIPHMSKSTFSNFVFKNAWENFTFWIVNNGKFCYVGHLFLNIAV